MVTSKEQIHENLLQTLALKSPKRLVVSCPKVQSTHLQRDRVYPTTDLVPVEGRRRYALRDERPDIYPPNTTPTRRKRQ